MTRLLISDPNREPLRLSWVKGDRATQTGVTYRSDGTGFQDRELGWYTGTSVETWGASDSYYQWWARSWNDAGYSGWTSRIDFYTTPKPPTTPTLASGGKVSWSLPSRYKHGVQVAYRDTSSGDGTVVDLGAVTSWTDPDTQPPTRQYRVRCWAGPSTDQSRTYSEWSDWSATAMGVTYKPPAVTKLEAYRCDSAGVRTETGTYIRVVSSGTVSSVKNGATETNRVTRKVAYRQVGTSTWNETTIVQNATPANWTLAAVTIGGGLILETQAWEVRYTVADAYTTTPVQALTQVPTSTVALSLAGRGAGVGKTWERGALDVGGDLHVEGNLHLPDPNIIVINGAGYPRSGVVIVTAAVNQAWQGLYYREVTVTMPFAPPPGWRFAFQQAGSRFAWVVGADNGTTATPKVGLYRPDTATSNDYQLAWQLVKI